MSLTGPFSTMPLVELLDWLNSKNRAGVLTVRGPGIEMTLHVQGGLIDACAGSDPPVLLGQFLLFHGAISEDDLARAMRAHAEGGRRLGDVLLESGAIARENLDEALSAKAEETVLGTFDHPTGWFVFDPDADAILAPIRLEMPIAIAIARGVKRAEDAATAAARLERPGQALKRTAKPPSAKINSAWPLRSAYSLVDGERTIEEIALHMHGTRFHVIQRLHQLFLEGFIELVPRRVEEPPFRSDLENGAVAPAATHESIGGFLSGAVPNAALDRFVPIAIPREFARRLETLSGVEKYLLTQCGGTRDLRSIAAVAPMTTQSVIEAVRSLFDRGLLRASAEPSDHAASNNL